MGVDRLVEPAQRACVNAAASRLIVLDPETLEPFEIGAWLVAVLAFPTDAEVNMRREAADALCNGTLRVTCAAYPADAAGWREDYPVYAAIDLREQKRRLRSLPGRLNRRMLAARMSLGFLEEGVTGAPITLPDGMKRLSLNELSDLVLRQSRQADPHNVEQRTWRPAKPVIHLAGAMQIVLRHLSPGRGEDLVPYPIDDGDLHRVVIGLAEVYEGIVLGDPRLRIGPDTLIRVRLAPPPGTAESF